MVKRKILAPFLVFCLLLPGCQIAELSSQPQSAEHYSTAVSSLKHDQRGRQSEYVIALDQSGSMKGSEAERNAAAIALINSLPEESWATVFFFTDQIEDETPNMLSMADSSQREQLIETVKQHETAVGSTDLGGMMETALSLFSDRDKGSSRRQTVFVITDGMSYGANGLAESRNEEFFRLCQENRDKVETYVVYISENDLPESLSKGLRTQPIGLDSQDGDTVDECRSRLTVWEEGEAAKILSIPNTAYLETALMNLRFAEADAIYNRNARQDTTISFPVYPLHAQEITIALSAGASVLDTIQSIKVNGGKNLLETAMINEDLSTLTLSSETGLKEGLCTVDVSTQSPVSFVIACQYGYQIQYGFAGADTPQKPPVNVPLTFYMRLTGPDGSPLEASDSVMLYALMRQGGPDGDWQEKVIRNGEEIQLTQLQEDGVLELLPAISYGDVEETGFSPWPLVPTDYSPVLSGKTDWYKLVSREGRILLGRADEIVTERETPLEDLTFTSDFDSFKIIYEAPNLYLLPAQKLEWALWNTVEIEVSVQDSAGQRDTARWTVNMIQFMPLLMIILGALSLGVFVTAVRNLRKKNKLAKLRAEQDKKRTAAARRNAYAGEVSIGDTAVRAGIRWKIIKDEKTYIGGLGLTAEDGSARTGCQLHKARSYTWDGSGLRSVENPLPFGIWKYSESQKHMELILRITPDTKIGKADKQMTRKIPGESEEAPGLCGFGVSRDIPFHEICIETHELSAVFQLEYYTDQNPLYQ